MYLIHTDYKASCIKFDTGGAIGSDTGSAIIIASGRAMVNKEVYLSLTKKRAINSFLDFLMPRHITLPVFNPPTFVHTTWNRCCFECTFEKP